MKQQWRASILATTVLVAAGTLAHAEEGVAMKGLLGDIGLIAKDKDPIRYRDRAPLVLPPRMELREPAAAGTSAANDPQWPKDPDLVTRQKRSAEARIPVDRSETRRMSETNPRLSIDEIRSGRSASATSGVVPGTHRGDNARDMIVLSPDQMAAGRKTADAADDGPPVRKTLSEPPTAFRVPARGGKVVSDFAPKIDQQTADANPINWLTRKFQRNEDDD